MKNITLLSIGLFMIVSIVSCVKSEQDSEASIPAFYLKDHIMEQTIYNVRLADGAPMTLHLTYRWKISNVDSFRTQFVDTHNFDTLILRPRVREIADIHSVKFQSIDSVFTSQREKYINTIRQALLFGIGGNEATIKEVIITELIFPPKYTSALEDISLKKKEIERIKQQSLVDVAQSEADKKRATAQGLIHIAQAEANGRLEKIKATTEKSRRASQLALAETQSQVAELKAQSEARKRKLSIEVELDKDRLNKELERHDMIARNKLELDNDRNQNTLTLDNQRKMKEQEMLLNKKQRQFDFDMEVTFAQLCTDNPDYATYLVNKELASQVEIAILPTGAEMSVFENVINNTMGRRVQ